jgi:hypothetical protein
MSHAAGRYLGIYLNDHLAGAAVGVGVASRLHRSNEEDPELAEPLAKVREEIEADRATLESLMESLGVQRGRVKPALASIAERLGRFKPNGQITGYSPLSRLVELELLLVGVNGKLQLWRALARALGPSLDDFDFTELADRATQQRGALDKLHGIAAERALRVGEPGSADA